MSDNLMIQIQILARGVHSSVRAVSVGGLHFTRILLMLMSKKRLDTTTSSFLMVETTTTMLLATSQVRKRMYALYVHIAHGALGRGVRRKLPQCVQDGLRIEYPNSPGQPFVGYHQA